MRILEVREKTVSIASPISNAFIDFSKMTCSVLALITDIFRGGKSYRPRPRRPPARALLPPPLGRCPRISNVLSLTHQNERTAWLSARRPRAQVCQQLALALG